MLAEKARQDALANNNNNNDSEASLVNQVDYQTEFNETHDEMEDEKQKEETEKRKCLSWLVWKMKDKQKYNAWRRAYQSYYPYKTTYGGECANYDIK